MAYDPSKDPFANLKENRGSYGKSSRAVTPSDSIDMNPYPKAVVCLTSGNISVIPMKNADADTVDFVDVAAGFVVPFQVRRVMSTGTTATVATVED